MADQFTAEPARPWTHTINGPRRGPPKSRKCTGPPISSHREVLTIGWLKGAESSATGSGGAADPVTPLGQPGVGARPL